MDESYIIWMIVKTECIQQIIDYSEKVSYVEMKINSNDRQELIKTAEKQSTDWQLQSEIV